MKQQVSLDLMSFVEREILPRYNAFGPSHGLSHVQRVIANALKEGKKVAVVMIAKKELAYRFADMFVAVDEARRKLGGKTLFVANMDGSLGLPRIRRYCSNINAELDSDGVTIDSMVGGLDEYAVVGEKAKEAVDAFQPDLRIILGICHAYPDMG